VDTQRAEDLRSFVYQRFAHEVGLPTAELLAENLTLAEVVKRSPKIVNSVDLMECFARTSNALRREHGVRVRLPAYPVTTEIKTIVDSFIEQVEQPETRSA
jgi:hypothetical protein